jgi:hypothetical protein
MERSNLDFMFSPFLYLATRDAGYLVVCSACEPALGKQISGEPSVAADRQVPVSHFSNAAGPRLRSRQYSPVIIPLRRRIAGTRRASNYGPEDQQRASFDRDRHLLCHEFHSAHSRDSNERSLPKWQVESPSQTDGNFLEFLGIG